MQGISSSAAAKENQIKRAKIFDGFGQRTGGGQRVAACAFGRGEQGDVIHTARHQLAQGSFRTGGAHGHGGHGSAVLVAQLQGQLHGGFIRLVQYLRHEVALQRQVAAHVDFERVRHLLDEAQNVHSW